MVKLVLSIPLQLCTNLQLDFFPSLMVLLKDDIAVEPRLQEKTQIYHPLPQCRLRETIFVWLQLVKIKFLEIVCKGTHRYNSSWLFRRNTRCESGLIKCCFPKLLWLLFTETYAVKIICEIVMLIEKLSDPWLTLHVIRAKLYLSNFAEFLDMFECLFFSLKMG